MGRPWACGGRNQCPRARRGPPARHARAAPSGGAPGRRAAATRPGRVWAGAMTRGSRAWPLACKAGRASGVWGGARPRPLARGPAPRTAEGGGRVRVARPVRGLRAPCAQRLLGGKARRPGNSPAGAVASCGPHARAAGAACGALRLPEGLGGLGASTVRLRGRWPRPPGDQSSAQHPPQNRIREATQGSHTGPLLD